MFRILFRSRFLISDNRPLQTQTPALRRQLLFRASHLGVRELDLVIGLWAKNNLSHLEQPDLLRFNSQVLQHQTPDLLKKILGQTEISKEEEMIWKIREFALDKSISKIENT